MKTCYPVTSFQHYGVESLGRYEVGETTLTLLEMHATTPEVPVILGQVIL
jgi:hypothetical protein